MAGKRTGTPEDDVRDRIELRKKLVVVGDGGCGKTCLLIVYSQDRFPEEYVPTVFENYVPIVEFDKRLVEFALWDTAGQEEYDRLRPLSYPETDVILLCYAVDYPASFVNVQDKWLPEIAHFCEGVPFLLVALKTDLRDDPTSLALLAAQGNKPITSEQGEALAKEVKASRYVECSARTTDGVQDVFQAALEEACKPRIKKGKFGLWKGNGRKKCMLL
ncbi:RHO4 protein [Malassezia vespertilionis]|uniref:Rho4p n=1 Tax=Malassezia vespertilionis TaxID=2020962 RepID=A0A2N1J7C0_9BASI|nr:RHO4 protein [Malassezia vespertilionis]PKI82455.1 Rho4p [Malassezia vespertilionis]WFD08081.1 RHO4 protein [Malassezia vespertilionis]